MPYTLAVSLNSRFLGSQHTPIALVHPSHLLPGTIAPASAASIILQETSWVGSAAPKSEIWIFSLLSHPKILFSLGRKLHFSPYFVWKSLPKFGCASP